MNQLESQAHLLQLQPSDNASMNRDTSRFENTRPKFSHPFAAGSGTTTLTSTSIESAMALALAASGGGGGGGGIQDMEYDCESTASTSSSSSLDQEGMQYAAAAATTGQSSSSGGSLQLRLVHPEYVDCSSIPDDAAQEDVDQALDRARRGLDPTSADSDDDGGGNAGKPSTCNKATFPTALFDILADPELGDIISWLPHGRSWKILDMAKFNESVLSSRFNQSKYTSFVRQVNGWGFRRVTVGSEANTYYHELFLRGRPGLLRFMRRQPASLHNTALRIRRNLKQVDQEADPDFYAMAQSYPLPPNCPTNKTGKGGRVGSKSSRSTARRPRSNSKAKAKGKSGGGNGSGNSTSQQRQRQSRKRRSSATASSDVADEDVVTKPRSRSSSAKSTGSGGGGRKSRKNSGSSSPRDSYVESNANTTDADEAGSSGRAADTAMGGVLSYGQAQAVIHNESLAGSSWHQETDALTFLDDPEVQAHGRLLQCGEGAPEIDGSAPGTTSTASSNAWGMSSRPSMPTASVSSGVIGRPAQSSSMTFANSSHSGQPRQSSSCSSAHPYQQQSASSIFPVEPQNYASVAPVQQQQQPYGQGQRVDHYQHRQQALDFHSSYSSYATANSSASTMASEPALSKPDAYCQAFSAVPIVTKNISDGNRQQNDNQRLTASEILPMLQCLFD